ncbi:MAG: TRM11 family SAM-dependent methyltransferase [Pseudanabaena sp.]
MESYKLACHLKSYIQPFERTLAIKELKVLAGNMPIAQLGQNNEPIDYTILSSKPYRYLADRLTYWESVTSEAETIPSLLTRQVCREATTNLVRNGISSEQLKKLLPFHDQVPLENRRNLRYGSHGIHEYRGKFFPQLVRSLLNIANTTPKSKVLDPMCGSGTTPTEAILLGCQAYGVDLNPLSVLVSQVKCNILSVSPERLVSEYKTLKEDLLNLSHNQKSNLVWLKSLELKTQEYLSDWFSPEIMEQLDSIMVRINQVAEPACRNLFKVSLSNIIRNVSWQKNDDLRVRREIRTDIDIDVLAEFLDELNRSVKTILALLYENQSSEVGNAQIVQGNTQFADRLFPDLVGQVDTIITSPPYATALPYLDTDRLSLYYLNLLPRSEHRRLDYDMIGNREVTNSIRKLYWEEYQNNRFKLTNDIVSTIDLIHNLNSNSDVGFRRLNLPSLLARYFFNMKQVFETFTKLLRPGASAYVVVGNNHTIAGGQRIEIETDKLLAQLGEAVGFKLEEQISMEMLGARDIFKKNAGNAETILFFRNG